MVVRVPIDKPLAIDKQQTMEKPRTDRRTTNNDKPSSSRGENQLKQNSSSSSSTSTTTLTLTAPPMIVSILLVTWIVYVVVWHAVLSNLPLSSPMGYAVHSRFWMQVMPCHCHRHCHCHCHCHPLTLLTYTTHTHSTHYSSCFPL